MKKIHNAQEIIAVEKIQKAWKSNLKYIYKCIFNMFLINIII